MSSKNLSLNLRRVRKSVRTDVNTGPGTCFGRSFIGWGTSCRFGTNAGMAGSGPGGGGVVDVAQANPVGNSNNAA